MAPKTLQIPQKSIKIGPKIKIKINPKNDWIFDRFLIDFGWILEGFWEPKWLQNPLKIDQKSIQNGIKFMSDFRIDLEGIF